MNLTGIDGTVQLRNGVAMPYLGLGVFQMNDGRETIDAVHAAVRTGYRLIDTASLYGNERSVGDAVRSCGLPRDELFITTKVWNSDQGYDATLRAFDRSLARLRFDSVDLYLVHWPVRGKYLDTWKALERLYEERRVRAIGVSNFLQHHLEDVLSHCTVPPMVDQVEFHPQLVQQELVDFCAAQSIQLEAWSPLMQGKVVSLRELRALALRYDRSVAQVVLRWDLQKGVVTIPKSSSPHRIAENAALFDFTLSDEDMKAIDALDRHRRVGADPDNFNF